MAVPAAAGLAAAANPGWLKKTSKGLAALPGAVMGAVAAAAPPALSDLDDVATAAVAGSTLRLALLPEQRNREVTAELPAPAFFTVAAEHPEWVQTLLQGLADAVEYETMVFSDQGPLIDLFSNYRAELRSATLGYRDGSGFSLALGAEMSLGIAAGGSTYLQTTPEMILLHAGQDDPDHIGRAAFGMDVFLTTDGASLGEGVEFVVLDGDFPFTFRLDLEEWDDPKPFLYNSPSADATLASLQVAALPGGVLTLDPDFDRFRSDYVTDVAYGVDAVQVTASATHVGAKVYVNNNLLESGPSRVVNLEVPAVEYISIRVVAADGVTEREYMVAVRRAASPLLANLTVSASSLDPAFDSATNAYTLTVPREQTTVSLTPTLLDLRATLTVNGAPWSSGLPYFLALPGSGDHQVTLTVTAPDGAAPGGTRQAVYTVNIRRLPSDIADLALLMVTPGELSPAFDPDTTAYTAAVAGNVTSAEVRVELDSPYATVSIDGGEPTRYGATQTVDLAVGENPVNLTVTAEDGTQKSYTLTINRTSGRLKQIQVKLGGIEQGLSPAFHPDTPGYAVQMLSPGTVIYTLEPEDPGAQVLFRDSTLQDGQWIVAEGSLSDPPPPTMNAITVIDQLGGTTGYVLSVNMDGGSDSSLQALTVSDGALSPAFDPGTSAYAVDVPYDVSQVTIDAETNDPAALALVQGMDPAATGGVTVDLNEGSNVVTVISVAPNGSSRTYTLTVNREVNPAAIAAVDNIEVWDDEAAYDMTPGFDPEVGLYTVDIPWRTREVQVRVTPVSEQAQVVYVAPSGAYVPAGALGERTRWFETEYLNYGPNLVRVLVQAGDGILFKEYTIQVNRAYADVAALRGDDGLQISPGSLSPAYDTDTTEYTAELDHDVESLTVTATPYDPDPDHSFGSLTIAGTTQEPGEPRTIALTVGDNIIPVVVTAPDGQTTRTYTISAIRLAPPDLDPPSLVLPLSVTVEATAASGASVTFTPAPAAVDAVDGPVAVSCSHASGGTFPLGTTTVHCDAWDAAGNTAEGSFTVTVVDTTPPVLQPLPDLPVEATDAAGATVSFSPAAADAVDGAVPVTCTRAAGSTFPLGTTLVTCLARDSHGNQANGTFTVTVADNTAPAWPDGAALAAAAVGDDAVTLTWPAASDAVGVTGYQLYQGDAPLIDLDPDTLTYTVTDLDQDTAYTFRVAATDNAGHTSEALQTTVTIAASDVEPPVLTLPEEPITAEATSAAGAAVDFADQTSAQDAVDGAVAVTCTPASGSTFPLGQTQVDCSAQDAAGNTATGHFVVTVSDTTPPAWPVDAGLTHSQVRTNRLTLSWPAAADALGVTGYQLYRGEALLVELDATVTTYTVTGLSSNTLYTFRVEAADAAGNRSAALQTTVQTEDDPPPPPPPPPGNTDEPTGEQPPEEEPAAEAPGEQQPDAEPTAEEPVEEEPGEQPSEEPDQEEPEEEPAAPPTGDEQPCAPGAVCGDVDPKEGGIIGDTTAGVRLEVPAGAVSAPEASRVRFHVTAVPEQEVAEQLASARPPEGFKAIGKVFSLQAELDEGDEAGANPVTQFAKPVTLVIPLDADDLAASQDPEKIGLFRLNDDGTLTFVGGKLVDGKLVVEMHSFSRYVLAEVQVTFADLDGHWARETVELMAAKYVVKGLPDGRFDPAGTVTRARFAAMLARAMGLRPVAAQQPYPDLPPTQPERLFIDVGADDWFYPEVMAAAAAGLVQGHADGAFRPHDPVTREQAAAMVMRALRSQGKVADAGAALPAEAAPAPATTSPLSGFADADRVSAWAAADLVQAIREGLIQGQGDQTLSPQAPATRAEATVIIARFWRR